MSGDEASFATNLSRLRHVLRTPVGDIIGYTELMIDELAGSVDDEALRDLRAIAGSGERLIAMIEEHLGAAKRSLDELDVPDAQFQLRLQLNHISGYTEMLRETAEDEGHDDWLPDLDRIAAAEGRLLELLDEHLQPSAFEDVLSLTGPEQDDTGILPSTLALATLAEGGAVLVVDTNPTNRDMLERRLRSFGHSVTTADGGEVALAAAAAGGVDLILMELVMDGWSGLETLRRLKEEPTTKDIPVVILSTVDDLDQMVACVLAGADDYLMSPIRPILLQARVGAALEQTRLRRRFTRQLRIFISSPGDVIPERRVLKQTIQQLDASYGNEVQLVPILWEEEPLVASETFQTQIIEPHEADIYLAVLWSRIGSPLPGSILRPDGTRYDSGTVYEFEDAMRGFEERGHPQILMYRKTGTPTVTLDDRDEVLERLDQMERLDRYVESRFRGEDGSYVGAFHQFAELEELESMAAIHLRKLIDRWLADQD
jgi:DNA-binding response OmpR family regulator